ncbi:hypothetical protein [Nocardia flavorosea]|uniref:hypothetical protein n=1 Tax=Nocardia flavorosea TaxID=53429 RepID=UPI001FE15411|nr:hypothetical protein [Nocardia flavorosea]
MRYTEIGMVHHEPVGRYTVHESGFYSGPLDEADVDSILSIAGPGAAEPLSFELRHHGGAYRKPPEVPNVVGGRDAEFTVYLGSAIDPRHDADRALHASARDRVRRLDRGSMLNFLGAHTDPVVVAAAFSAADLGLNAWISTNWEDCERSQTRSRWSAVLVGAHPHPAVLTARLGATDTFAISDLRQR